MATGEPSPLLPSRLLVPWTLLVAAALAVGVGLGVQGVDYPTPFAVSQAYRLLVGVELFFLLAVVPLLGGVLPGAILLLALAAPADVVAAWVADCDWTQVAASQAYLAAAAVFVAAWRRADPEGRLLGWYGLALGALGAGAPLVAFVADDLLRARADWAYALSPFWVADRLCLPWQFAWAWALPAAVLLAAAATLFGLSLRGQRPGHRPELSP